MAADFSLEWTSQFEVLLDHTVQGDRIVLPPSALEQLLAAAPVVVENGLQDTLSHTPSFDPYNPHSYAAERHARAETRYTHQQLPHPLTFRLVNPTTGRVVYAGVKEFSAEEGHAVISHFVAEALGIKPTERPDAAANHAAHFEGVSSDDVLSPNRVTVHVKQLPKGKFVKFRPLEAGYDPEDWKSLLEEHLRKNYTTLTRGEVLTVPFGRSTLGSANTFQLLVDELKPDGDGICVVDTDLEVDIEALNEEQARDTMRQISEKMRRTTGTATSTSSGGQLDLFRTLEGQILPGDYVDYELPSWDKRTGVEIEVRPTSNPDMLELFISPFSHYQRAKPRDDGHVFADVSTSRPSKRVRLSPTNVELEQAEALWISVHVPAAYASTSKVLHKYTLRAMPPTEVAVPTTNLVANEDEILCKNCLQLVPKRTLTLHENFCLRNNILCTQGCGNVFQKRSETWSNHWHCTHDDSWGNDPKSHQRHDDFFHKPSSCQNCAFLGPSLEVLARHRTTTCPGKLILCRFCHLEVAQEGDPYGAPNAEALLSGLTPHELADGARTTECHICQRIVRLRDMITHLKHHDLERLDRLSPRVCRNVLCGRTLDGTSAGGDTRSGTRIGQGAGNDIGLCSTCFGPLYVSTYDPEGKALKRRVERRYLSQVLTGCGKNWCRNEYCKNGRQHTCSSSSVEPISAKDAIPMIKPFLDGLHSGDTPLHFCVDESSQKRRQLALMMAAESRQHPGVKSYGFEWCIGALEAEGAKLDRAMEWLKHFAPAENERRV